MINVYELTIIIPHYNNPKGLKKLIETIPNNREIQILVIDDKSDTDLLLLKELKKEYSNSNVLFLDNTSNKKGAGVCRNIGLQFSEGKWILFADSDDYFLKNFYNIINKYFETNYEIIYFCPTSIDLTTNEIADRHLPFERLVLNYLNMPNKETENKLRYRFNVPWSKMIKKSFIEKYQITFDEVLVANDVMFSTKAGHFVEKYKVTKERIYCVTKGKGSLTTKINKKAFYQRLNIWIDFHNYIKKRLNQEEFKKMKLSGRHFIITAIKYKFNIREIIKIYKLLKKNQVHFFDKNLLNPIFLTNKIRYHYKTYKNEKKFYD